MRTNLRFTLPTLLMAVCPLAATGKADPFGMTISRARGSDTLPAVARDARPALATSAVVPPALEESSRRGTASSAETRGPSETPEEVLAVLPGAAASDAATETPEEVLAVLPGAAASDAATETPEEVLAMLPGTAASDAATETPEEVLAAASALFDAGKYADAAQKLDGFLASFPQHPRVGAAALALGRCRTELKQYDRAIPAYERAVATKDAAITPLAQLGLGEAAVDGRQYEKAVPPLEAVLKTQLKHDQQIAALIWLGQADYQLQRYAAAQDAYDQVVRVANHAETDFVDDALYGAGLALLKQGKQEEARRRLSTLVEMYPNSADRPAALLDLGRIDVEAKRWPDARTDFERLLNEAPGAPAATRTAAETGLAQALLELGDYAAAVPRLQALIGRLPAGSPEWSRAELSLGNCQYRGKLYDQAIAAYSEAAKSADDAVAGEALYWSGNVELARGEPAAAVRAAGIFERMATRYPKHPLAVRARLRDGDALAAAKQTDAAARAYRTVLTDYPQAPEAAEARKALDDLVTSIADPEQLAAVVKTQPAAQRGPGTLRLARIYIERKQYDAARSTLTALLMSGQQPEIDAESDYLLGVVYTAQQKPVPAEVSFSEALRLGPTADWAPDAQGRLAWIYLALKKPDRAEAAATAALGAKLDAPGTEQARLALVQADVQQQKWDAALGGCQALLGGSPAPDTVAAVLYTQGWVSQERGKPDDAEAAWQKLVAEHPHSDYAAQALLLMGDSRLKASRYDDAAKQYSALLAGFASSQYAPEARYKLGSALFGAGKAPEAAAAFDEVARDKAAGDWGPEALYWAGVAYEKANKRTEAIERLTRLVTEFPKHTRAANARIRLAALKAVGG